MGRDGYPDCPIWITVRSASSSASSRTTDHLSLSIHPSLHDLEGEVQRTLYYFLDDLC